jgi:hypothetical protein
MEIVGMEMKQSGMFMARQMFFKDVSFEAVEASLTLKFIVIIEIAYQSDRNCEFHSKYAKTFVVSILVVP